MMTCLSALAENSFATLVKSSDKILVSVLLCEQCSQESHLTKTKAAGNFEVSNLE